MALGTSYSQFRGPMEGNPHGSAHVSFGGMIQSHPKLASGAVELQVKDQVAWGKEKGGLQAGLCVSNASDVRIGGKARNRHGRGIGGGEPDQGAGSAAGFARGFGAAVVQHFVLAKYVAVPGVHEGFPPKIHAADAVPRDGVAREFVVRVLVPNGNAVVAVVFDDVVGGIPQLWILASRDRFD